MDGAKVTGKIKLPDAVKEPFVERDWAYNRIELTKAPESEHDVQAVSQEVQPSKWAVFLKKSETESQTGTYQFDRVPPGTYSAIVQIFKTPEDSTSAGAGFTDCLAQFMGQITVPEGATAIEMPPMMRLVLLWDDTDALIFSDGQWTNEKTGEVIPDGSIVQGTHGAFRIEQENGIGKVVKLAGDGATGQAEYIRFSDGGNAIVVSRVPFELLKELEKELKESGLQIGQDDVFVFDNGEWRNEQTGDVIPLGTLVAGTQGIFRLERDNDEGKITPVIGSGAIGHGKYIRWSHGGNAFSDSRP
jgi:hypothetical protein